MTERMDTEEFAARVAAPLKAPVEVSPGFDARVLRAIEAESRGWWRRRMTLRINPLVGAAVAASFAALMLFSGAQLASRSSGAATVAAVADAGFAPETVHVVRFVFADAAAQSVALAGDFNGWSHSATPLEAVDGAGRWVIEVALPPGRHEYAFVVDGKRWVADPFAVNHRDEFGQESSIVRVGELPRGS